MPTIGTCSKCSAPVQVPDLWGGTVPPVPTCAHCGATAKDPYGSTIPMEKRSLSGGGIPSPLNGDFDCPKAEAARSCPCGFCRALRTPSAPVVDRALEYLRPHLEEGTFSAPDWAIQLASILTGGDGCGKPVPPSAPVGVEDLIRRIDAAIERITSGRCTMRVPADPTDPDLVLADAGNWIQRHALAHQPAAEHQRQQPCGCVLCVCEDEKQCHGCGAKHCGNRTDHPAYVEQQPAAVDEAMVFRLAVWMAKKDGHDDPHHLIGEGSPPEPWGEVWNRYEDDARSALTAALAAQPGGSDNGSV